MLALMLMLGGWPDVVFVQTPKDYVLWQEEDACNISIKAISPDWSEQRGIALYRGSQGQRSTAAEFRFNSKPMKVPKGNGWIHYYANCDPMGPSQCSPRDEPVVRDSTWCAVIGANFADESMMLACIGAPNGLEGGTGEWQSACVPNGPHMLSSLMTLVYVDPWGVRSYRSNIVPAVPLDEWVALQARAVESDGILHASMTVSFDGEEYPLDSEFQGAYLSHDGLVGVQPGTMPQTLCTGLNGRPVRSMARKCGGH